MPKKNLIWRVWKPAYLGCWLPILASLEWAFKQHFSGPFHVFDLDKGAESLHGAARDTAINIKRAYAFVCWMFVF